MRERAPPPPRDMSLSESRTACIEIVEPAAELCPCAALPPEGNVKLRNYRMLNENLRAYTPTGDVHTSPGKGKLVARFDACSAVSPPRHRILELVRPEDPGREALEAIVRPAPRRGLVRPLDDDTRRFLQRALLSPSPYLSESVTPEPAAQPPLAPPQPSPESSLEESSPAASLRSNLERSLAEELHEAEQGGYARREVAARCGSGGGAAERERLGRLALAVEEDEAAGALGAAARRLDALLAESRALHRELAAIHEDLQVLARRAARRDV